MSQKIFALLKNQTLVEIAVALAFFLLALSIRLPNLMMIPAYTDELFEVMWGYDIALGKHFPLYAVDAYDGPFYPYLIALLFRLFGFNVALPRLMVLVFGALTVVVTYALARVIRDRVAGLVAGAFTLTSPILIVAQSHQGWSSSLMPFFVTLTTLAMFLGVTRQKKSWLAASGLFAGLSIQTHPTSSVIILGLVIFFMMQPEFRNQLKQPAPYIALGFFVLGYAPMIIANAHGDSPLWAAASERHYAFAPTLDPAEYARRLVILARNLGYSLGNGIGEPTLILRAQAIAAQLGAIIAMIWAWHRNERMIPLALASGILLLPVFVVGDSYRYYFALVPLMFALWGICFAAIRKASSLALRVASPSWVRALRAFILVLASVFALGGLFTTEHYYRAQVERHLTNAGYWTIVETVHAQRLCGNQFYLDISPTQDYELRDFPEFMVPNVSHVLALAGCEHLTADANAIKQKLSASKGGWVLISPKRVNEYAAFDLQPIVTTALVDYDVPLAIVLYRAENKR